ncbi:hypothetical protein HH214_13250 [Mucilaginibacter robiniae]|uniref:Uncharacterized protein n=1 Tax=Mucilaginibacter robiniae TaxID=2728022 RepID=A0A7L5E0K9_9SPHI|nr:hypothetical protein [Mucilaginibacter robiniae]QJD96765.1 hypothetical protein HH214_13250 [Mucilaginibacter robiniae]
MQKADASCHEGKERLLYFPPLRKVSRLRTLMPVVSRLPKKADGFGSLESAGI